MLDAITGLALWLRARLGAIIFYIYSVAALSFATYVLYRLSGSILGPPPQDRNELIVYRFVLAASVAIVSLPLLFYRARVNERQTATAERQAALAEQGHITERIIKATELLGATRSEELNGRVETVPAVEIRLGAIFALERVAKDSDADRSTILETFAAYLRENLRQQRKASRASGDAQSPAALGGGNAGQAAAPFDDAPLDGSNVSGGGHGRLEPREDVLAVLLVLNRLIEGGDEDAPDLDWSAVALADLDLRSLFMREGRLAPRWRMQKSDLRRTDLRGARLEGADLRQSKLLGADLRGASLQGALLRHGDFGGARLSHASFTRADLAEADLTGVEGTGARFENANLANADLTRAKCREAVFERARLEGANLTNADLRAARLNGAALIRAELKEVWLEKADLTEADLSGALCDGAVMEGADLHRANLSDCRMKEAKLQGARLEEANLSAAQLRWTHLKGANLTKASLGAADLRESDLREAVLTEATLEGAVLTRTHLASANLRYAKLTGAKLIEAQLGSALLHGARLDGADLNGAALQGAHLWRASLRNTNLYGANLIGAHLRWADVTGANFAGARLIATDSSADPVAAPSDGEPFLGLTQDQLDGVYGDLTTRRQLDALGHGLGLTPPNHWAEWEMPEAQAREAWLNWRAAREPAKQR